MNFERIKRKVIEHLEKLEEEEKRGNKTLKKALYVQEILEKANYPVGTIRTWKGKRYIKTAPGKWQRKYENESRGAKLAISALKKKAQSCKDSQELLQLILQNKSRFLDDNGRPLPFVQELSDYVSKLNDGMEEKEGKGKQAKKMDSILHERTESAHGTNASREKTPDTQNIPQSNSPVNKPSKESKAKDNNQGIDKIRSKYNSSKSIEGDEDEIYVGKESISGKWKLVEADAPSASHDERTFQKTKGFPTDKKGGTINDRDYEHDKAAQEAVIDIASDYDGRALSFDSPVVVTADGIVISGNNRTMSSKIAARKGTDKKYIDALKKRAKKFGFTAEDVEQFKNPRVVFEADINEEYTTEQFAKFNRSGKKAMDPIESAVKVSKTIKSETVEDIALEISEFDTLGELYADKKSISKVFNSLIDGGMIQKTDLPAYYTESGITGAGKEFLETVMIGSVIDESNIRQLNSEGAKSIRQKLVRAITPLIENKGMKGYSINKEINEAVQISIEVAKNKDRYPNVEEFGKQQDLFRELNPVSLELAKKMEGTQKDFAQFMLNMNGGLRPAANGEGDIFFGGVESKEQIVNRMLGIKKAIMAIFNKSLKWKKNNKVI